MNTVKEFAYAKINLFLDVTSRREDGYHNIQTVMHQISLCDELTIKLRPAKVKTIKMYVEGAVHVPVDNKNLAYRAVDLYMSHLGVCGAVDIYLKKNIPVGAGLGGGSADAAAALRAMNRLYKRALSPNTLLYLAQMLGSDVPFCLFAKTAYCSGRGEVITPIVVPKVFHFVIAIANEFISTPKAYEALDLKYSNFDGTVEFGRDNVLMRLLNSVYYAEAKNELPMYNIFEDAVLPLCKGATKIKETLAQFYPLGVMMSGSGPAVYAVFDNLATALQARDVLTNAGYRAFHAISKE